jgi:hypothetical protein
LVKLCCAILRRLPPSLIITVSGHHHHWLVGEPLFDLAKHCSPSMPGMLMSDRTATSVGLISPASRSNASAPEVA